MSTTKPSSQPGLIARKAQFLNMQQDGLKIRSNRIESKKIYKRAEKHVNKKDWN